MLGKCLYCLKIRRRALSLLSSFLVAIVRALNIGGFFAVASMIHWVFAFRLGRLQSKNPYDAEKTCRRVTEQANEVQRMITCDESDRQRLQSRFESFTRGLGAVRKKPMFLLVCRKIRWKRFHFRGCFTLRSTKNVSIYLRRSLALACVIIPKIGGFERELWLDLFGLDW